MRTMLASTRAASVASAPGAGSKGLTVAELGCAPHAHANKACTHSCNSRAAAGRMKVGSKLKPWQVARCGTVLPGIPTSSITGCSTVKRCIRQLDGIHTGDLPVKGCWLLSPADSVAATQTMGLQHTRNSRALDLHQSYLAAQLGRHQPKERVSSSVTNVEMAEGRRQSKMHTDRGSYEWCNKSSCPTVCCKAFTDNLRRSVV